MDTDRKSSEYNSKLFNAEPINYKEKLIFYFFTSMLECIIDSWESCEVIDNTESIASGNNEGNVSTEVIEVEEDGFLEIESFTRESPQLSFEFSDDGKKPDSDIILKKKKSKSLQKKKSIRKFIRLSSRKQLLSPLKESKTSSGIIIHILDNFDQLKTEKENVTVIFQNGNKYEGPMLGRLMHGKGKFTWTDGTVYIGDFENGTITGKGETILPDQSYYVGEFLNGFRHGTGTMSLAKQNCMYRGKWLSGKRHGFGYQLFEQNNWYEGEWQHDLMNGVGTRQYPSGAKYHGEWKHGGRHGKGYAIHKNNDFYTGEWAAGKRQGYGEYTWNAFYNKYFCIPVQAQYFGAWKHNKMHGVGLIHFGTEGGARYAGCFRNHYKHGPGVLLCDNGTSIESNPLFINDKPIHTNEDGSLLATSSKERLAGSMMSHSMVKSHRKLSTYQLIVEKIFVPTEEVDLNTIASYDYCEQAFPKKEERYESFDIPITTPCELITVTYYIDYLLNMPEFATNKSSIVDIISNECSTKNVINPEFEETSFRKAVIIHLIKLKSIYYCYTNVACLKQHSFKTRLIRLFLWQFYRDCNIPQKGLPLSKIDELLENNQAIELESRRYPFEIIYFWQFLHSLLTVALHLYCKECVQFVHQGILRTCFNKLLETDIYPNSGHHKGWSLFDFIDVLPLQAVYKWFEDFGDPFTALDFLRYSSTINKHTPPSYCKKKINEAPNIRSEPLQEPLKPTTRVIYNKLFFLRSLGAKKVVSYIHKVCPSIIESNDIVNLNIELTFLEFYDIVLLCVQDIIDKEKVEERKRSEQIEKQIFPDVPSFQSYRKASRTKRFSKKKI